MSSLVVPACSRIIWNFHGALFIFLLFTLITILPFQVDNGVVPDRILLRAQCFRPKAGNRMLGFLLLRSEDLMGSDCFAHDLCKSQHSRFVDYETTVNSAASQNALFGEGIGSYQTDAAIAPPASCQHKYLSH